MSFIHQPQEIIQGKYCITGILGKGGVAITYSAIALETNSPVAIKVISLRQLDNWKQVELFQREAEVLKQLSHPNIPDYIDYFDIETETDKAFYLVQQLAPGKSLHQLVESGWRTNEKELKAIAQQVLEILSYLHSLDPSVIHRDIKPSNLIRSDDGKIYLVDFGAVKNTYYNTLMQGSTVVGTYGYMAPEQFRGQALPATDLYSLGTTLLYLLTHRSPAELPQDTLKLDFRDSINISESFSDWLEKILEPDIEDRFGDADVALVELFRGNKKKHKKLIVNFSAIFVLLGLIAGVNSYKWFFLSNLGFHPDNMCSNPIAIQNYLNSGGKINIIFSTAFKEEVSLVSCVVESDLIKKNDKINLISELLKKGYNPDYKGDENNDAPLINATDYRFLSDIDLVAFLLKNGADPNVKDRYGGTALFRAVRKKDPKIANLLIKNGADVNALNNNHETPLFNALYKKDKDLDTELIEFLIEKGANVNITSKHGSNPLSIAVKKENTDLIKLLIRHGANVNAKNKRKYTALQQAIFKENIEIVRLLIEHGADVDNDKGVLFSAVSQENIEIVKLLLENGADVEVTNTKGNTVLFNAASQENIEIVKLLLENGADTRIKNKYDESPLANVKTREIAELLIKHGADVNAQKKYEDRWKVKYGNTPLFNAISRENADLVRILLENGADVHAKDEKYNTPLFHAVSQNNFEIVRLLIKHKSNVIRLNGDGKSILFYAQDRNIVKILIDNGANVNAKDLRNGNTPLYEYVKRKDTIKNKDLIQLLIDNGADIHAKGYSGQTPLSMAIFQQNKDLVQLLIDNGADISYLNAAKIREIYRMMRNKKHMEIELFLQENKFNISKK